MERAVYSRLRLGLAQGQYMLVSLARQCGAFRQQPGARRKEIANFTFTGQLSAGSELRDRLDGVAVLMR